MVWGTETSPKGTEALYREQDGKLLIEIELKSLMQILILLILLHSMKKSLMQMQKYIFIIQ